MDLIRDLDRLTIAAFESTGADNALRKLDPGDRMILFTYVFLFEDLSAENRSGKRGDDELERIAKVVADGAAYASKLETDVFNGPWKLMPWTAKYRELPTLLRELSSRLQIELDQFGERGHKAALNASGWLINAVEFARAKTGHPCYEDIAELCQAVGKRPPSQDFSGEAIRKKLKYIKRSYRLFYETKVHHLLRAMAAPALEQANSESPASLPRESKS